MSTALKAVPPRLAQAPRYLTVKELMALLQIERRTVYNMVHQKRIPYRKVGGRLRFEQTEIDEWTKQSAGRT